MIAHAYLVAPPPGTPDIAGDVIGGLPNLLRQALSLQDAGVRSLTVIGGSADPLRADPRVKIRLNENAAHPPAAAEPALVARAGCIWHPQVVRRLVRTRLAAGDLIAAGSGEAIVYACGAARCEATIAAVASAAPAPLPAPAIHQVLEPPEFVVLPRTDAERSRATRLLLRSLEKKADGLVSRHLHRPMSRAVTRLLLAWPVTPNVMTLAAAAVGVAGVAIAWTGGYRNLLAGALLFELQNILDGCDGEIARLKHLRSRAGEWLDQIADDALNIAFLAAVGMALSGGRMDHWAAIVSQVAIVAQVGHLAGLYAGLMFRAGGRGSVAVLRWFVGGGTAADARGRLWGDLTRRDFCSLLYVVTAALDVVGIALVWHGLVTVGSAVVTTVQWIAWNGPEAYTDADGAIDPAGDAAV